MNDFAERFPRTLAQLEHGRDDRLHIGAQVYVSRDATPLADFAWGESRPGVAMTTDSILLWMSAGKPVAAVAIAQLVEQGLASFDDPVARHIPAFAAGGKEAITIRHLLTHTGGFRSAYLGWPNAPWDDIITRICAMPLEADWIPGQRAGYHVATSWFILGEIVRQIDARAYWEYVRDEIFIPLQMRDAWVGMPPEQYEAYGDRIGVLQNTEGGKLEPHPYTSQAHVLACAPGSNAHGPAHDLGRFYEMLVGRGAWNGVQILRPETVELL
ncbi:MAG TPA: serine hydrolase domain-containing protein, partial [Planctomycetaceae bacterium]|nr:serine hydrolase domain-containing protein [Planctomycetaceae bacterium]